MGVNKRTLYTVVMVWSLLSAHELYYTDNAFHKYSIIVF